MFLCKILAKIYALKKGSRNTTIEKVVKNTTIWKMQYKYNLFIQILRHFLYTFLCKILAKIYALKKGSRNTTIEKVVKNTNIGKCCLYKL